MAHRNSQRRLFFGKTAVVTFGGARAVLAYIAQEAVEFFGWLAAVLKDVPRPGRTKFLDSSVIGSCLPRHRHGEFLKFLERIDDSTPRRREIHLILDNYGTHTHPKVQQWFAKHPRYHLHFTPTSASWLNLVERWFAEITRKRIPTRSHTELLLCVAITSFGAAAPGQGAGGDRLR